MKKTMNYITLEFLSRSSNEAFARTAVACFAAQMDPTLNELEDIKTAVSEAVTNAIVHGYPNTLGKVMVKARICEGNVLEVAVKGHGRGIPEGEQARGPRFAAGGEAFRAALLWPRGGGRRPLSAGMPGISEGGPGLRLLLRDVLFHLRRT